MAYFLKKTPNKKGIYLSIYFSRYDSDRKETVHKSYKSLGYVDDLIDKGIDDPITYYQEEVKKLNASWKEQKDINKKRQVQDDFPLINLGYFAPKAINEQLKVKRDMGYLSLAYGFHFDVYEMMCDLIYSRLVHPASKQKTYDEVIPSLGLEKNYSLDQLYSGLEFLGQNYERVIEIYNHHMRQTFGYDTTTLLFDATNFYFEIDEEDDFRRRGPSKENRHDPIVGLGLLLDKNAIPIGMTLYPGNESEKPKIGELIGDLKEKGGVSGHTIRIADKGLNCADNIAEAILCGDGYIFSKSVYMLPEKEISWVLDERGFKDVVDHTGHLAYRFKSATGSFTYKVTGADGKKHPVEIEEKRIVTFNPRLREKKIAEINRMVERARSLCLSGVKKKAFGECAKYATFTPIDDQGCVTDDRIVPTLNHKAIRRDRDLAGYNMLVTSEVDMKDSYVYDAYHALWRIEETFKVMKTDLEARPVYLQKKDTICGHFLICYLAVLLLRLLQFRVLDNRFSSNEIIEMIRSYNVVEVSPRRFINTVRPSEILKVLKKKTGIPLLDFYFNKTEINSIINARFLDKIY